MSSIQTPFDFGAAVTQLFQTSGGAQFGRRLWFWTTLPIAISLLIAVPLMAPHYGDIVIWYGELLSDAMSGGTGDLGDIGGVLRKMLPGYLVMMFGIWGGWVMGEAALHRKALLNFETPGRPIRLGADELRVFVAQLGVMAISMAFYFGAIILGAVFASILGGFGALLFFFIILAALYFMINFFIRLYPAGALSVREGEQRLMSAREVSKGKFWQLFGAFIVVYIAGYVAITIAQTIGMSIVFGDANLTTAMMSGDMDGLRQAVDDSALRLKNPLVILGGVLAIILYSACLSLMYLSISGVGSYAVRWWAGDNDTADTFS